MAQGILHQIMEAYFSVTWGWQEPDVLWCSPATKEVIKFAKINQAIVKVDPSLPDGEIFLENTSYPEGRKSQRYNKRFTLMVEKVDKHGESPTDRVGQGP